MKTCNHLIYVFLAEYEYECLHRLFLSFYLRAKKYKIQNDQIEFPIMCKRRNGVGNKRKVRQILWGLCSFRLNHDILFSKEKRSTAAHYCKYCALLE